MNNYKNKKLNEINDKLTKEQYLTGEFYEHNRAVIYLHNANGRVISEFEVSMTHDEFVNFLGNDL